MCQLHFTATLKTYCKQIDQIIMLNNLNRSLGVATTIKGRPVISTSILMATGEHGRDIIAVPKDSFGLYIANSSITYVNAIDLNCRAVYVPCDQFYKKAFPSIVHVAHQLVKKAHSICQKVELL